MTSHANLFEAARWQARKAWRLAPHGQRQARLRAFYRATANALLAGKRV